MALPHRLFKPDKPVIPLQWNSSHRYIQAIEAMRAAGVIITARRIQDLLKCRLTAAQDWLRKNRKKFPAGVIIVLEGTHRQMRTRTRFWWMRLMHVRKGNDRAILATARAMGCDRGTVHRHLASTPR